MRYAMHHLGSRCASCAERTFAMAKGDSLEDPVEAYTFIGNSLLQTDDDSSVDGGGLDPAFWEASLVRRQGLGGRRGMPSLCRRAVQRAEAGETRTSARTVNPESCSLRYANRPRLLHGGDCHGESY